MGLPEEHEDVGELFFGKRPKTGEEIAAEAFDAFDRWCKEQPDEDVQGLSDLELVDRYYAEWLSKQPKNTTATRAGISDKK